MTDLPNEEPQDLDLEPPETDTPAKLDFYAKVYGWLKHVHLEVDTLRELLPESDEGIEGLAEAHEKLVHIDASFEEALRDLELHVPEDRRGAAIARSTSRAEAMIANPLPEFPAEEPLVTGTEEVHEAGYE